MYTYIYIWARVQGSCLLPPYVSPFSKAPSLPLARSALGCLRQALNKYNKFNRKQLSGIPKQQNSGFS